MAEHNSFLGKGWSFPPRFSQSGHQLEMVALENDVKESLKIILSTNPGERVMHPHFGCGIQKLVYEPISQALFTKIKDLVQQSILRFESRVKLEHVEVDHDPALGDVVYISIDYSIIQTNTRQNMVYPLYLIEGTNINRIK